MVQSACMQSASVVYRINDGSWLHNFNQESLQIYKLVLNNGNGVQTIILMMIDL